MRRFVTACVMTQRIQILLLVLSLIFLSAACVADRQGLGYVEFALAVAGIVSAVLSWVPARA